MSDLVERVARAIALAYHEDRKAGDPNSEAEYTWDMWEGEARAAIRAVAEFIKPTTKRPCNCTSCYCGNTDDARDAAMWDAENYDYLRLLSQLDPKTPEGK